ncbi:protoheme IX farnesyltransferase [bacterium]|nr:protoheme IX farnesyltransferase [bacterium]PIU90108.1 MAG: protoheme IX farnesyltransferase [Anaerolineae bacterium CG06_land_8_20_14_3_00_57_67]PJH75458.1 MAG: protoheme IX farnesyltransferase [Anaerolineae bacterium CG_4_9_14_0_8_um_filter_58_9]
MQRILSKLRLYWPLTKSLQTGLLLSTGLAGYMSARCPVMHWYDFLGLALSLFLAIAGSTIINMWYDRDIDAKMKRTCNRPLASGQVTPNEALRLGLVLSAAGVGMAVAMSPLYGLVVFAGLFFDVAVYTLWLKRRTCWSIVWGGISGGMPILAGRVFGLGHVDGIGILLALAVLFWIPTHILTFSMRYFDDYAAAGIPTFPSAYGFQVTRATIAVSSIVAALCIGAAGILIGVQWGFVRLLAVLSAGLLLLAVASLLRPSERVNFGLFKYASLYMLAAMVLLSV